MRTGRPTKYNDEMLAKSQEYLDDHESLGDPIPSAAGLAITLGVNKDTLYEWAKHHPDFSDMLGSLNSKQEQVLLANGLMNVFNPTITKLVLAKQGYSDKTETDITSKGESIQPLLGGASVQGNNSNQQTPETE